MTLNVAERTDRYTGDGTTDTFAVTFQFYSVAVYADGELQTFGVDYTTSGGAGEDGEVVFAVPPASGVLVVIVGNTPASQSTAISNNDDFPAAVIEKALDKAVMVAAEAVERIGRSIRGPIHDNDFDELDFRNNPSSVVATDDDGIPFLAPIADLPDMAAAGTSSVFRKAVDDSDDISEGAEQLFVTPTDRLTLGDFVAARVRSSFYWKCDEDKGTDWLYDEFPDGSGHGNFVAAPETKLPTAATADFTRITAVGATIGMNPKEWDRVEAIGQGAMRWGGYAERVTAIGTLAFQWGGADLTDDPEGKYYWHDIAYNAGVPVTDGAWDFDGLETANPGIRATIAAWFAGNPWATATTDFARNVGLGRDAGCEVLRGVNNTFLGYRAGARGLDVSANTFVGADAGAKNIFGEGNTGVGYQALINNQDGDNCVGIGRAALNDLIASTRMTALGYNSGDGVTGGSNSIYIGPFAGFQDAGSGHISRLYIQGGSTGAIVGDLANAKLGLGVGLGYADLINQAGSLLLRNGTALGGAGYNSAARNLVIEDGAGNAGITVKTANTAIGSIVFADPEDNNVARVQYTHSTNRLDLYANDAVKFSADATGVGFNSVSPIARPVFGAPTGTATRTAFETGSVTTEQLAERLHALIDDLTSYGLLSAT